MDNVNLATMLDFGGTLRISLNLISTLRSTSRGKHRSGHAVYTLQGTSEARIHTLNNIKVGRCAYRWRSKSNPQGQICNAKYK